MDNKFCSICGTPLVNGSCPQCSYDTYQQQQNVPQPKYPRVKDPNNNFFDWLCEFFKSPCAAVYRAVTGKKNIWALIILGILCLIEPISVIANITGFNEVMLDNSQINFLSYLRLFCSSLVSYGVLIGAMIIVASLMGFRSLDKYNITALCGTALIFKIPVTIIVTLLSLCLTTFANGAVFSISLANTIFAVVFSLFAVLMAISLEQGRKAVDCFKLVIITVTVWLVLTAVFNHFISGITFYGLPTEGLNETLESIKKLEPLA